MARPPKKKIARPRVLWQFNPSTRVKKSVKKYSRIREKSESRRQESNE